MGEHVATDAWWKRLLTMEPAVYRGVIGALVSVGLIWGADFADLGERIAQTLDAVGAIVALITPFWIRQATTPAATVVARVDANGDITAGDASPFPTGLVVQPDVTVGNLATGRTPAGS
jgi:hypothetical protein